MAGHGGVHLVEAVEDQRQLLCRDAHPLVPNPEDEHVSFAVGLEPAGRIARGELQGVVEQIREDQLHPLTVAHDRLEVGRGEEADARSPRAQAPEHLLGRVLESERR